MITFSSFHIATSQWSEFMRFCRTHDVAFTFVSASETAMNVKVNDINADKIKATQLWVAFTTIEELEL